MQSKRFQKNDQGFRCVHCGKEVLPQGNTSRNHCPFCLTSLHVDILPGDRQNPCRGEMRAVYARPDTKKGYILTHRCLRCGALVHNRAALDAKIQPDNAALMIHLTTMPDPEQSVKTKAGGSKSKKTK